MEMLKLLEAGTEVSPVLTTSSGFLRYPLNDRLLVEKVDSFGPVLKFLGRNTGVDMVGEKIDEPVARKLIESLQRQGYNALCLIAVQNPKPHYVVAIQNHERALQVEPQLAKAIELELAQVHHYQLARELGQLSPASILFVENALVFQEKLFQNRIIGQNKPEFLCQVMTL